MACASSIWSTCFSAWHKCIIYCYIYINIYINKGLYKEHVSQQVIYMHLRSRISNSKFWLNQNLRNQKSSCVNHPNAGEGHDTLHHLLLLLLPSFTSSLASSTNNYYITSLHSLYMNAFASNQPLLISF